MYNAAFLAMNNLVLPKDSEPKKQMGNSLLSRSVSKDNNTPKEEDVSQRIAKYVSIIRKDRMELKNG
tara:strand:+ start:1062 stop:1262 length:201 start_codon:yes stop_codon:yes gene_type:complete